MLELQQMTIMTIGRLTELNMRPKKDCGALVVFCPQGGNTMMVLVKNFERVIELLQDLRPVKVELEHSHGEHCPELQQAVAAYITECALEDCAKDAVTKTHH